MQPYDLDIGVVYTHERELMPRLLETMSASGDGLRMRLLLVDNASRDLTEVCGSLLRKGATAGLPSSSLGRLPEDTAGQASSGTQTPDVQLFQAANSYRFAETRILRNSKRLPYAANLNRILNASTARYVLLMNTDMYFDPRNQCLARMVDFMDSQPQCGLAGCRLYHADGADAHAARQFQTLRLILARRCGLGRVMQGTIDRHFYADNAPEESWPCDWLSGCFLMVRRDAIEEVGHFDERYGKYFEDVDIGLRMARAGWRVMYHGAASCVHLEQRASKNFLSLDAWTHFRAYLRWLGKWGLQPSAAPPARRPRRRAA